MQVLDEVGAPTAGEAPKPIDPHLLARMDVVVTLGEEAQVDHVPGPRFETWVTDEPSERGIDGIDRMRLVRDNIAARRPSGCGTHRLPRTRWRCARGTVTRSRSAVPWNQPARADTRRDRRKVDMSQNPRPVQAPLEYRVSAATTGSGGAQVTAAGAVSPVDATWGGVPGGPGPAELLAAALAACLLKNLSRCGELIDFRYDGAEVDVVARRQDSPPGSWSSPTRCASPPTSRSTA